MEEETLLTVQEAAQKLGVWETAIRNAMAREKLPFVERYGRKLIRLSDLEAYDKRMHPEGGRPRGRPRLKKETEQ